MTKNEQLKHTQKIIFAADLEGRIKSAVLAAAKEQYQSEDFQKHDDRLGAAKLGITVDILDKDSSLTPQDKAKPKYILDVTKGEYRVQFQLPCDVSRDSIVKGFAQKGFAIKREDLELDEDVSGGRDYDNLGVEWMHKDVPTNQYIIYLDKIKEVPGKLKR
jgi:hypothetical protein